MRTAGSSRGKNAALRGASQARGGDFVGLVPFGAGMFVAVLVAQAMIRPPVGEPQGTAALAQGIRDALGTAPSLWIAIGCAALGARWFMLGRSEGFARHLGGITGMALGLALVAGAFSDVAGGVFGAFPRRVLGGAAGGAMSALLGLALFGGAVWLAWVRGSASISWRKWKTLAAEMAHVSPAATGVSEEEAAALLPPELEPAAAPEPEPEPEAAPEPEPAAPVASADPDAAKEPLERPVDEEFLEVSSPYPEDVRRKGEIPDGARPLDPPESPSNEPRTPPADRAGRS